MQHLCRTAGRCTKMAEGEGFEPSRRLSRLSSYPKQRIFRTGNSLQQIGLKHEGDDSYVFNAAVIYPGTLIAIHNHCLLVEIAALHERSCRLGAFVGIIDRER